MPHDSVCAFLLSHQRDKGGHMQAFFADNPVLQNILDMAAIIIPLSMLFAFCGISILAVSGEVLSLLRRRGFYGKCAMQLSMLGQGLGWTLLVGGRVWLYFLEKDIPGGSTLITIHEVSWLVLGLSVIFSCIYFLLWKTLAQYPGIHIGVGIISALQGILALLLVLVCLRIAAVASLPQAEEAGITLPQALMPVWGTDYATSLCYIPFLLLAMPAAFGCVWLLLRRKKDDFGRDHYNTVLPWCAAWARNAWGVLWLLLLAASGLEVFRLVQAQMFTPADGVTAGIRVLLWLVPVLLWFMAARSTTPLRHKIGLSLSLVLSCLFTLPFFMGLSSWTPLP